jgi:DNA-binding beta-propeller fold protein YncE
MRRLCESVILGVTVSACGAEQSIEPPPPTGTLVITPFRLVMGVGMSRQVSATVLDPAGEPVDATVSFVSADPGRAVVTLDGLVSYVAAGQTEIRVSSEDLTASIPYTGLQTGHPIGTTTTSLRLPGDGMGDAPFGVAVDAEGRIFISQTNSARVASDLYPIAGFATRELGGGTPTSIALLAGGAALVTPTGPDTNDASVIELSSDRVLAQIPLDVPAFSAVASPDSQTAYLGTNDGRVLELDVASLSVTESIDLGVEQSRANHLALNAAGTLLYASSFTTGTISEIDLVSKSVARLFIVGGEPQGIAVSLDGRELFVADESGTGTIDVYDIVARVMEASIPSGATTSLGGAFGLAMSPDGARVYVGVVSTEGPGLIQVIDAATRTIERTIDSCGRVPRRIAFGYSGGLAVIADESGCATFVE